MVAISCKSFVSFVSFFFVTIGENLVTVWCQKTWSEFCWFFVVGCGGNGGGSDSGCCVGSAHEIVVMSAMKIICWDGICWLFAIGDDASYGGIEVVVMLAALVFLGWFCWFL